MPALNRIQSPAMYLQDLGAYRERLQAAVLVEAAVDSGELDRELEWMMEMRAGSGPVEALVVGWRPRGNPTATRERLQRLESLDGVVGVREVLHSEDETSASPRDRSLLESVRAAGERGLVVDLCVRPDQLEATAWLAARSPDTCIMIDHLGRPKVGGPFEPDWRDAMARLGAMPHVHAKLSGLLECAAGGDVSSESCRPVFDHVMACFGPNRLAWGSNWPVCHQVGAVAAWLTLVEKWLADRAGPVRESILGGVARRVYGLPDRID